MRLTTPFLPYFKRTQSQLGISDSIFYHVSADMEDTWANGIYHNSRYGIFHLHTENGKLKLELSSKGLKTLKFRKSTVKSEKEAVMKVREWVKKTQLEVI